jgi:uncharacterized caspase-like protein
MKKALVIGINDYPIAKLEGAINDAESVRQLLKTNGDGSPNFDVIIEKDVQTKSKLRTMIVKFFQGDSDIALLYFAGHGFLNELGGFIVTPDHENYDEGISMDEILNLANQSNIRNKIIILDCCHSGAFGMPTQGGGVTPIKPGISILTACRENEPSKEINGHGVFTNLMLEAINGGAADLRGHITPGGIYAFVDQALGAHEQRPVFKTNVTQFVSVRAVIPQVSPQKLRKITDYFETPTQEYKLDPSYEDTNSVDIPHEIIEPQSNPENVAIFKNLQKFQSVGLIVPVGEDHMYFAAMRTKSCKLTPLGYHYWRLVNEGRI